MFHDREGTDRMNTLSEFSKFRIGFELAKHIIGSARRFGLSCASRLLGLRWAARWAVARIDREGWREGRPTVLCLRRELFAKDIDALRQRCNVNFVFLNNSTLGRLQQYWISRDLTRQICYQRCRGPEYDRSWFRLATFGGLILDEVEHVVPIDAILAAAVKLTTSESEKATQVRTGLISWLVLTRNGRKNMGK